MPKVAGGEPPDAHRLCRRLQDALAEVGLPDLRPAFPGEDVALGIETVGIPSVVVVFQGLPKPG